MSDLGIAACSCTEAKSVEHFQHRCILGKNLRAQFLQSRVAGDRKQVSHQHRSDSIALVGIDDNECQLSLTRLHDDVASACNDHTLAAFVDFPNECNVIDEIDVHEEGDLLFGEASLGN